MMDWLAKWLFGDLGPVLKSIWDALRDPKAFLLALRKAQEVVAQLDTDPRAGEIKRALAIEQIVAALKQAGKTLAPYLINLAVELAVAALRAAIEQKRSVVAVPARR
jgi:hypothetical protein